MYKEMVTLTTMACMQYIAFDFETSGLPVGRRNSAITHDNLKNFDTCRAVSLSAARFSQRGRIIDTFDAIVLPTNFTISQDSIDIHGITQEKALKEGRPFTEVFTDFIKFIGPRTKTMIAHKQNIDRQKQIKFDQFNSHALCIAEQPMHRHKH